MHTAWRMFAENLIWLKEKNSLVFSKDDDFLKQKILKPYMEYLNVESHFNEWRELINHLKASSNLSINDHELVTLTLF